MKCIGKFLIPWASALLLVPALAAAQVVHISHCLAACPAGESADNEIVVRHLFVASVNSDSGIADWVAYRVLADTVGVASLLPRFWLEDSLLASTEVNLELATETNIIQPDLSNAQDRDYRLNEVLIDTGDSGRLVPMSSFAGTPYWQDLNYLSNMAPMPADLRLGSWSRLDTAVNELAASEQQLWVLSGPLYDGAELPAAYFKIVASGDEVAAFIFPGNLAQHAHYCPQFSSMAEVERRSGLRLFPDVEVIDSPRLAQQLRCDN